MLPVKGKKPCDSASFKKKNSKAVGLEEVEKIDKCSDGAAEVEGVREAAAEAE